MITLKAKVRKSLGKKVRTLRKNEILPAVLYGPEIKNLSLELGLREFKGVFQGAGESSLISLDADGKKFLVLVHEITHDPVSGEITHVDFYQPNLTQEVEVEVPLVFNGFSAAVKDLGGTLVKEIQGITVKALPEKLPHEIKIDISKLMTFEDEILVKDLILPTGVKVLKAAEEIIAKVLPPQKVEEELAKPIEEKVEDVEKVEKKEKAEGKDESAQETTETEKKETKPSPTASQKK